MNYLLSLKNVKQSVSNLSEFLKNKGWDIPHTTLLHAFSKALFFPNWNTLQSQFEKPELFQAKNEYILRIQSDQTPKTVIDLIGEQAKKADCQFIISQTQLFPDYLEIRFTNPLTLKKGISYSNLLTLMMIMGQEIKKLNWQITFFEYWQLKIEKQSLMDFFK